MPGILPMKVIKVGTSAQTRIAQACDRCRSKKIRCDGFRPCCSQCSNVGFECKTSDKLSRRAFPRGYTESLEERVRALENENRELKDLLDEKEEKIDMLSKVQSRSPRPSISRRDSSPNATSVIREIKQTLQQDRDDTFKVQQTPFLLDGEYSDSYFTGGSSGKALVDAFKRKVQESGQSGSSISAELFFAPTSKRSVNPKPSTDGSSFWKAPPRLLSDQMVNIFFQEWAPLFPILHRPTFLTLYDQYVSGNAPVQDKKSLAQLNLVFGIAALSNEARISYDVECCERQWVTALDTFIKDTSMINLQCLILAQIYCIQKGDHTRVLHYKSIAVGIAQRLGLHLSQKRFAFGALTSETRKRVFWTLYTVDCFSAASLGLPRQLRETDVHCEYPVDADDEYVTEKGFQPTLPGEFTKISSALALFRVTRILARVLEQNYPMSATHELSMRNIGALNDELDTWLTDLAPHLRMQFIQDKPSTNVVSSRSPLLSLAFYYIRSLIHRPAVCANIHERSSSSLISMASSSRSMIQILQLLEERKLSFSFCLNKSETLLLSGFGLLFQALDLEQDGKLMRETQKKVRAVIDMLERSKSLDAVEFRKTSSSLLSVPQSPSETMSPPQRSTSALPALESSSCSTKKQLDDIAARYAEAAGKPDYRLEREPRRATAPAVQQQGYGSPGMHRSNRSSATPMKAESLASPPKEASTPSSTMFRGSSTKNTPAPSLTSNTNLDYFSFPSDPVPSPKNSRPLQHVEQTSWDQILSTLGGANCTSAESIFDWAPTDDLSTSPPQHHAPLPEAKQTNTEWSPDIWSFQPTANSVFSLSEESLTSGEDFSSVDATSLNDDAIRSMIIPDFGTDEDPLEFTQLQSAVQLD